MIVFLDAKVLKSYRHSIYYEKNKGKILIRSAAHRKANLDKYLKREQEYRESNREKLRQGYKDYKTKDRERYLQKNRRYYENNKEKRLESCRKYRQENKAKRAAHEKKKRQSDAQWRLMVNLRGRLCPAIRNNQKKGSAIRDLGCSIPDLKQHLESQFDGVMTWDNWGEVWHLDHNYPLAAANLDDRTEFLAVNNWRNLQPLAVKENLEKNDKVTPEARKLFEELCKEFS